MKSSEIIIDHRKNAIFGLVFHYHSADWNQGLLSIIIISSLVGLGNWRLVPTFWLMQNWKKATCLDGCTVCQFSRIKVHFFLNFWPLTYLSSNLMKSYAISCLHFFMHFWTWRIWEDGNVHKLYTTAIICTSSRNLDRFWELLILTLFRFYLKINYALLLCTK